VLHPSALLSSGALLCRSAQFVNIRGDDRSCKQRPKKVASKFGTAPHGAVLDQLRYHSGPPARVVHGCVPPARSPGPGPRRLGVQALPPWRWRAGDGGAANKLAGRHSAARACLPWRRAGHVRPIGSESWVAYLARCARQRRCPEAPPFAAGSQHSLFRDEVGRLLACGRGAAAGHGDEEAIYSDPAPVAAMAGVRVRSVAAGRCHSLALTWNGRVYSWGENGNGQLGQGDRLTKSAPALVLRRRWWRGSRACAASPRLIITVSQ
jgi:hypothetical protein